MVDHLRAAEHCPDVNRHDDTIGQPSGVRTTTCLECASKLETRKRSHIAHKNTENIIIFVGIWIGLRPHAAKFLSISIAKGAESTSVAPTSSLLKPIRVHRWHLELRQHAGRHVKQEVCCHRPKW